MIMTSFFTAKKMQKLSRSSQAKNVCEGCVWWVPWRRRREGVCGPGIVRFFWRRYVLGTLNIYACRLTRACVHTHTYMKLRVDGVGGGPTTPRRRRSRERFREPCGNTRINKISLRETKDGSQLQHQLPWLELDSNSLISYLLLRGTLYLLVCKLQAHINFIGSSCTAVPELCCTCYCSRWNNDIRNSESAN